MRLIVTVLFCLLAGLPSSVVLADEPPTLETAFPDRPVLPETAEELLTAELLGPAATTYDARTRTVEGVDPLAVAVEQQILGSSYERLLAPDSLRRFAEVMGVLLREGRPMDTQRMFVAEHVGLSDVPYSSGYFMSSGTDADAIAKLVGPMVKDDLRDDDVRAIAVSVGEDEVTGFTVGSVWILRGEIDFEPFARRWEPGERASIPGLQVSARNRYALWVSFGGTEVRQFPIEGADGRFDIEIPLPEEPGVYRVAMSVQKKRRMPDNPFFFSLYVGVDPPAAYTSPLQVGDDVAGELGDWEDRVVAAINAARDGFGLAALELVQRDEIREIVEGAPVKDFARFRYFSRRLKEDPLPDVPHGLWHPTFSSGVLPADVAWVALEHPISRSALLDEGVDRLVFGAAPLGVGRTILLIATEPPPDVASAADRAREEVAGRVSGGLKPAVKLEAELDAIAAKIAKGKMPFRNYFGPIKALSRKGKVVSGGIGATALVVSPGGTVDLSQLQLPGGARYLAVGDAMGDLGRGDGIQYTVLVVVVSTWAK